MKTNKFNIKFLVNIKIFTAIITFTLMIVCGHIYYNNGFVLNNLTTFIDNKIKDKEVGSFKNENKKFVYPLGNIIGIKADTDGVLVIGYEEENVEYIGGIQIGDNIVEINKERVKDSQDVFEILKNLNNKLNKNPDMVEVKFERDNIYKKENIKLKNDGEKLKLGLWVRDKISGVGTMTFYNPENNKIGAIGHAIKDTDTNELLKIRNGRIYRPKNIGIVKSTEDKIGYIKGDYENSNIVGKFSNNADIGISGEFVSKKGKDMKLGNKEMQLMEVGDVNEVKKGKAYILFEDKNKNITSFEIKIEDIVTSRGNHKEIIINVVDKNLIDYTGGIVQGMSGAPIIQNNKIIGAVTHVSKEDSKKGYGILINEMIKL